MKSHAILRTNTGLTTNAKLVVRPNYELYLDCIDSDPELNYNRYKKFRFTKDHYWDEIVPRFFKDTPTSISYKVKDDGDNSVMFSDFSKQFDDLYYYGARNIYDNKDYLEEFEYFAPLHITKSSLPTHFVIFRVDGPGLIDLNKDNFRSEILDKLKVVKVFDMTPNTELGEFLNKNITKNPNYPATSLDIDFKKLEFSYFIGIDYETGGYTRRSQMLDTLFSQEMTFLEIEKFFYDGFKNNHIIYPHIINFSFLFDDTPATPTSLRKWSINRYLGFYLNSMVLVTKITPNNLPKLKSNVVIRTGNILETSDGDQPFENEGGIGSTPYVELGGNFYIAQKYYEILDEERTRVEIAPNTFSDRMVKTRKTKYKILSDKSLVGLESQLNQNITYIETKNNKNIIYKEGGTVPFTINDFNSADLWIIKIGDSFHKLYKNNDGLIEIITDYGFLQSTNKFEFFINESDPKFRQSLDLSTTEFEGPKEFQIYKLELSEVKDWDTDILETDFARYEYEEQATLTENDEPKLYVTNLNSKSDPKDLDDFIVDNSVVNIPVSSEYTANHETFAINNNELNELWKKNPKRVKWGFQNSLSDGDYPYLLNNSLIADNFNRTVNPYSFDVVRSEKVLDYFYSINSSSTRYSHHSLHIQPASNGNIIISPYYFDVNEYVKNEYDYFTSFFGQIIKFLDNSIIKNSKKWSYFNPTDGQITNTTLFRGLKFKIYDVSSISVEGGFVNNINLKLTNNFDDYKFSILLSENKNRVESSSDNPNTGVTQSFINNMRWSIIEEWKMDKFYKQNEMVFWGNRIYVSLKDHITTDPDTNPFQMSWEGTTVFPPSDPSNTWVGQAWSLVSTADSNLQRFIDTIFLDPGKVSFTNPNQVNFPLLHPVVFYENEFFVYRDLNLASGAIELWQGRRTYNPDEKYYYKGKYWKSASFNSPFITIKQIPGGTDVVTTTQIVNGKTIVNQTPYWTEYTPTSTDVMKWSVIPLWDPNQSYGVLASPNWAISDLYYDYTVYNNTLYGVTFSGSLNRVLPGEQPPDQNPKWVRLYSFEPDTNYVYGPSASQNNIILHNNRYYAFVRDTAAPNPVDDEILDQTLDQGIKIYINKKYRNILINISVNDSTYKKYTIQKTGYTAYNVVFQKNFMSEIDRESLYNDLFAKLTANNFMNAINDLNSKSGFTDSIKYIIINEDGSTNIYDFNDLESAKNLPHFISCEGPDEFSVRNNSIKKEAINLDENILKPNFKLDNGAIKSLGELNYSTDVPIANTIEVEKIEKTPIPNFSSLKNNLFTTIYRHSGFYSPIFKEIELFAAYSGNNNVGNFKFDTTLTNFGMTGERVISKINRKENVLKLSNTQNFKSIYPMLDEVGYHIVRSFIFKSTWDFKYYYECFKSTPSGKISLIKVQRPEKKSDNELI